MLDLNAIPLQQLFADLTSDGSLDRLLDAAMHEDLGIQGDITSTSIIPENAVAHAAIVARTGGMIAGLRAVQLLAQRQSLAVDLAIGDGSMVGPSATLARIRGRLRDILAIERTVLNLLGRLSGIATLTQHYVHAIAGTQVVICDTRKTTPGMRHLEKYAVRCGGGHMHRIGLFDAALYKDNHIAGIPLDQLTSRLTIAIQAARKGHDLRFVEVEVDTLAQLREVLNIEPGLVNIVLLDNMNNEQLREAVSMRIAHPRADSLLLECSGGVTLERVRSIAETGVDRISVGALTHSASCLDVGLDID